MTKLLGPVVRCSIVLLVAAGACSKDGQNPIPDGFYWAEEASVREAGKPKPTDGPPPSTGDIKVPPQTPPTFINGHVVPGCKAGLYQVNAGTVATTCANLWSTPDDVLQVTVGEVHDLPPATGRVYTVKPQSQVSMYPADGEATAVYIKQSGSLPVESGTFTINAASGTEITGSYLVQLPGGTTLRGAFHADTCPADCS